MGESHAHAGVRVCMCVHVRACVWWGAPVNPATPTADLEAGARKGEADLLDRPCGLRR